MRKIFTLALVLFGLRLLAADSTIGNLTPITSVPDAYRMPWENNGVQDYYITFVNLTNQVLSGYATTNYANGVTNGWPWTNIPVAISAAVTQNPLTNSVYGSNVTGAVTLANLPSGVLTNGNQTAVSFISSGVGTTISPLFDLTNSTAATLGNVQYSPALVLSGGAIRNQSGYGTNQVVRMALVAIPSQGGTGFDASGTLSLYQSVAGGAFASGGAFSASSMSANNYTANTAINVANTTGIGVSSGPRLTFTTGTGASFNTNVIVTGTLTATNGVVNQVKAAFTSNFTAVVSQQIYQCYGTNQVITLPSGAAVNGIIFRFASTNGHGSFILTNTLGTIRDGSSTSFTQIGIGSPAFISTDGGTNWWPAARTKVVFPNAQFSCSTNIPLTLANTAYPITFDSTDFNNSQGIALALGTNGTHYSKMWITNSGQYEFDPSVVISFGGNDIVRYWFKSNDTNIPNSCTPVKGQNNTIRVVTVPFIVNVTQPTAYEIWAESDNSVENILAQAAGGVAPNDYPAAPSIICPIKRISDPWP